MAELSTKQLEKEIRALRADYGRLEGICITRGSVRCSYCERVIAKPSSMHHLYGVLACTLCKQTIIDDTRRVKRQRHDVALGKINIGYGEDRVGLADKIDIVAYRMRAQAWRKSPDVNNKQEEKE